MPKSIKELASSILHCPEEITVNTVAKPTDSIKQQVYHIKTSHRRQLLQQIVKNKKFDSILVFVKTRGDTEYVLEYISSTGIKCDSIHKDKSQNARQRALKALKNGDIKVLVATDIASR
jgi:ATP-dependent RNA helicase RhlE